MKELTKLPRAPVRTDSKEVFVQGMENFVKTLPICIDEIQQYLNEVQDSTSTSISNITRMLSEVQAMNQEVKRSEKVTKEYQLLASQGVCEEWKSGTQYLKGNTVYSSINLRVYKAKKDIIGNTDPSESSDWSPALLHTGLFIDKAYSPKELQASTHWLLIQTGEYTLPKSPSVNEVLKCTNLSALPCTFKRDLVKGIQSVITVLPGASIEVQYSGNIYGWI